ncbi:hypothetical protein NP233_g7812 [Leucocoprinus birnbaumii]|uniref:Uncharacterized protein n=1 Tax=Leucocoprinus birnbaumii TaxID=56174 RepID=A0AAD5YUA5_9AGAR|nr:hypothetical protein NP233_g7812 [Leucocoprinus birnbaumii]
MGIWILTKVLPGNCDACFLISGTLTTLAGPNSAHAPYINLPVLRVFFALLTSLFSIAAVGAAPVESLQSRNDVARAVDSVELGAPGWKRDSDTAPPWKRDTASAPTWRRDDAVAPGWRRDTDVAPGW